MVKKIVCLVLSILMILPLVSCAAKGGNTDVTTAAAVDSGETTPSSDTQDDKPKPNLPDTTYDGFEFVVFNTFTKATKYTTNAITSYEQTGDSLNDAIYKRTMLVEDKYKIKIVDTEATVAQIKTTVQAAADDFSIATIDLSNVMSFVNTGNAVDFNTISTIDLEKPWWDQNAKEKLSFGGKLYYTFSDFLITQLDNSRAMYFSKQLISDLGLESPYDLVKNNQWTIEKMREMGLAAVKDLDGSGKLNSSDRFGVMNNATTFYEVMLTGCEAEIVQQGADGNPYFYCFDNQDRFVEVYQKLLQLFSTDNVYFITDTDTAEKAFMQNQSLFMTSTLSAAYRMRAMDTDFGILPVPKYNSEQEKYYHVSPNPHAMVVPVTVKDLDRTGVILEALSYYSSSYYSDNTVIPAYFELAIKGRTTRDSESMAMLDIIHDNISYVIKIVGTTFSDMIFGYFAANKDVSSLLAKQKDSQEKKLAETLATLGG